ncbi:MAG: phytoene desaturase, partial [Acetobacteraceae bacterium]|nr:phytoene desaturase [Acetobacteraceae bacterium]
MARLPGTVAVIGSGLAGLASSVVLAARGHDVVVYEKNPWLGGKAAVLAESGFRFDMGPTILTLPSVLRRIFAEAGREIEQELPMTRLDPQWRCLFEGGDVLDLREDVATMAAELDRFAGGRNSDGYRDFITVSKRLHDISEKFFFWKSVEGLRDTLDMRRNMNPDTLAQVLALRMGSTVAGVIRRRVPDARVAQMLDHFTQYVGSSPFASPAVLCAIGHMQTGEGIWYPHGGTRAVVEALVSLGRSLGVRHQTGIGIARILSRGGRVSAIRAEDGTEIPVTAVVSNMDSVRTHRELVGDDTGRKFERERRREPACSGVVLYLGLNRAYDHLAHHTFVFSRDPKREFDDIYRRGEPADDPT